MPYCDACDNAIEYCLTCSSAYQCLTCPAANFTFIYYPLDVDNRTISVQACGCPLTYELQNANTSEAACLCPNGTKLYGE